jgi:hypothetical protein
MDEHKNPIFPPCASTSLTSSGAGNLRQALNERLTYPEAIEVVGKLLGLFPNGSPANAKGYIGGLSQVLIAYPKSVSLRCSDPLKGVAKDTRFLPTVADLVAWCERETIAMRKPVETVDHFSRLHDEMIARREEGEYWQKARATRLSLDELRAKHGPDWGIKGRIIDDGTAKKRQTAAIQAGNDRALALVKGGTISAGIPITQALLDNIEASKTQAEAAE